MSNATIAKKPEPKFDRNLLNNGEVNNGKITFKILFLFTILKKNEKTAGNKGLSNLLICRTVK